ncbi:HNH nuclease [Vibrio phage 1.029.O._10N.261.55.A7]|nr:HNH nuclease [Vibrio phage 1.029.O._10N.261.55.A7]
MYHLFFLFCNRLIMACKIDGCGKDVRYKQSGVCQMHYFRMMRTGSYELTKRQIETTVTPNGYARVHKPGHPLSVRGGYVFEHRYVLFEKHKGGDLKCEMCGADWLWRPYKDHVDHIDEDKLNNDPSNLRPLCNSCNTRRTKRIPHTEAGNNPIEFNGETKTAEEWSRDPICTVKGYTIRNRIKSGWSIYDSITKPSRKSRRGL